MDTYAYTPSSVPIAKADWPTLQTLIDAGTRVVNFLAQNADVSTAPYLIDEFTNVWETPYDVCSVHLAYIFKAPGLNLFLHFYRRPTTPSPAPSTEEPPATRTRWCAR